MERPRGERMKAETGRGQVRNPEGGGRKRRGSERKAKSGYCCSNFTMGSRLLLNPGPGPWLYKVTYCNGEVAASDDNLAAAAYN